MVYQKDQEDSFYILKILLCCDQTNNELHYTEAISKHRFRVTQSDIDTVQGRDI